MKLRKAQLSLSLIGAFDHHADILHRNLET